MGKDNKTTIEVGESAFPPPYQPASSTPTNAPPLQTQAEVQPAAPPVTTPAPPVTTPASYAESSSVTITPQNPMASMPSPVGQQVQMLPISPVDQQFNPAGQQQWIIGAQNSGYNGGQQQFIQTPQGIYAVPQQPPQIVVMGQQPQDQTQPLVINNNNNNTMMMQQQQQQQQDHSGCTPGACCAVCAACLFCSVM